MGGADGRSRGRSRSTKARAVEQISIGCQSRGTEQTAEQMVEQRAIGRSRQPDGRRRGRSRAGRADKRTEQRRTGGSADGGGRAEPGRLSPDSQVRRPFSSPSPLFSPPLSPHAAAMGAAHAGVWPRVPPPPREASPVRALFPARADLRSCGVIRRHGRRLGVLGDAIRETVVAR
jgi:hypothetical protein